MGTGRSIAGEVVFKSSPTSSTLLVRHAEPRFELTRTHVFGGRADTVRLELVTDGRVQTLLVGGRTVEARLHWDEEILVFDSTVELDDHRAHNVVRYRLADAGSLLAEERFRSDELNYDNVWCFERE